MHQLSGCVSDLYFHWEVCQSSSGCQKQLRMLAAERETTIQALLAEALNDPFAKYDKPEIAPVERSKS
jgi:hypothetical protein